MAEAFEGYVKNANDWQKFINGDVVVVSKIHYPNYYRKILVSSIEIVIDERNQAYIRKRY